MWHVYNWILFNNKKKEILPFVTTWIILSEVRQRKTYTNTVWSHLQMDSEKRRKKDETKATDNREETNGCQRQWLKRVKEAKATNFQL